MREATARKPKSKPVPAMRIELMPLTELAEWPGNPKEHDEATLDGSLDRFGYVEVIVLDEGTRRMVVGHGRRERLLERKRRGLEPPERVEVRADGEWLVPVQRGIAFDNEREAEAYLLTSNQSTIAGGYHEQRLAEMLSRHTDNLTGVGWNQSEADALLARTRALLEQPAPVEPEPPKRPSKPPRLRPADVVDSARVIVGDMRSVLAELEANSVDSVCSDPPYGLEFMGKRWDQQVPGPEYWREVMRVLKPGAHLVAFGGTRTAHRLACAIEDAGFEVRDCISWLYGSGFPKSLDVGKAIDREAGAVRDVIGPDPEAARRNKNTLRFSNTYGERVLQPEERRYVTAPATDAAQRWNGWGTALKPAHEPVFLARKPNPSENELGRVVSATREALCKLGSFVVTDTSLSGRLQKSGLSSIVSSLLACLDVLSKHASKCTIETASALTTDLRILKCSLSRLTPATTTPASNPTDGAMSDAQLAAALSRSVCLKCERLVVTTAGEIAIDLRVDEGLDRAGGEMSPNHQPIYLCRKPMPGTVASNVREHGVGALNIDETRIGAIGGGTQCTNRDASGQCRGHRNAGQSTSGETFHGPNQSGVGRWPANVALDEAAARELDAQSGSSQSSDRPRNNAADREPTSWGKGANVSSGYTDFGGASRFFYTAKASRAEREAGLEALDDDTEGRLNQHPTVKPVSLMRWLIRMITPPGGLVLDPFCGSGSTGVAAVLEGSRFIGVELNAEYAEVARGRIAHYADEDDEADA